MGVKRSLGHNNSRKVGELNGCLSGERVFEMVSSRYRNSDQEWRKCLQTSLSSTFIFMKITSFITLFKNILAESAALLVSILQ